LGRAPGSTEPGGPRRRKQSRGPHRSRRQPTLLSILFATRCGPPSFWLVLPAIIYIPGWNRGEPTNKKTHIA
jgi:hypothetical protein